VGEAEVIKAPGKATIFMNKLGLVENREKADDESKETSL
jgi:hypothetical protein